MNVSWNLLMREAGRDLWAWLQEGAEFFVCGDKERMAADVDRELHAIAETHGGLSPEAAKAYVEDRLVSKFFMVSQALRTFWRRVGGISWAVFTGGSVKMTKKWHCR